MALRPCVSVYNSLQMTDTAAMLPTVSETRQKISISIQNQHRDYVHALKPTSFYNFASEHRHIN